jgi:hypothetical protein
MLLAVQAKIKEKKMKKIHAIIATALIIGIFTFSSCKKCSICVVKEASTGNQITSSDEMCGSKSEVATMEDDFKKQWDNSYTVSCSTN